MIVTPIGRLRGRDADDGWRFLLLAIALYLKANILSVMSRCQDDHPTCRSIWPMCQKLYYPPQCQTYGFDHLEPGTRPPIPNPRSRLRQGNKAERGDDEQDDEWRSFKIRKAFRQAQPTRKI